MLENKRVILRPLSLEDEAPLLRWINDPATRRLSSAYWPVTILEQRKWIEQISFSRTDRVFAVEEKTGRKRELIGTCGLFDVDWQNRRAELRIRLGSPGRRGLGLGREALTLLLRFGFRDLNLHRIHLSVFAGNRQAIGLYERLGFTREGRARESVFVDGAYTDEILMAVLCHELPRGEEENGGSPH